MSEHRCASCGTKCPHCRDGKHCAKAAWCTWCANAYADNPPIGGTVYCRKADGGCGAPFPSLAVLIERGLSKFPRFCRECREERREAAAAERELNARVGAASVVAGNGDSPKRTEAPRKTRPKLPAGPPPAYRAEQEQRAMSQAEQVAAAAREQAARDPDAHAVRGGFVPRPAPAQREFPDHGEFAYGKTEWPGTRVSSYYDGY